MKESGQLHAQDTLTTGKELPLPIQKEAEWVPGPFSKLRKSIILFRIRNTIPRSPKLILSLFKLNRFPENC